MSEQKKYIKKDYKLKKIKNFKVIFNITYIKEFLEEIKKVNIAIIDYECFQLTKKKKKELDNESKFTTLNNIPFFANAKKIIFDEKTKTFIFDTVKLAYSFKTQPIDTEQFYNEMKKLTVSVDAFFKENEIEKVIAMGRDTEFKFAVLASKAFKINIKKEIYDLWSIFNWKGNSNFEIVGMKNHFSMTDLFETLPLENENLISSKKIGMIASSWFSNEKVKNFDTFLERTISHGDNDLERGLFLINWLQKLVDSSDLQEVRDYYIDKEMKPNLWDI